MPTAVPKYFKAWIIYFLIATFGWLVFGVILSAFIAVCLKLGAHAEKDAIKLVMKIVAFTTVAPMSYLAFRLVVAEFIVKDLTKVPPPAPPAEPPTL